MKQRLRHLVIHHPLATLYLLFRIVIVLVLVWNLAVTTYGGQYELATLYGVYLLLVTGRR